MQVEERSGNRERAVLIGMIVNNTVCGRVASKWNGKEGHFDSTWANIIGRWCTDYYKEYGKAPSKGIKDKFYEWAESPGKDKETVQLVGQFLAELSQEYTKHKEELNPDFVVDQAGKLFQVVQAKRFAEKLTKLAEEGKTDEITKLHEKYHPIELGGDECINVLEDEAFLRVSAERDTSPIIKLSGALGQFYGSILARGKLVAFFGSDKSGKSFTLLDLAVRALSQRRRVAYFEAGDLTKDEVNDRFRQRIAYRPLEPCTVNYPTAIEYMESLVVTREVREYKEGLDFTASKIAYQKFKSDRMHVKSDQVYLKLSVSFNDSLTVADIRSKLKEWERTYNGWTPDVVVVDYADILAPPVGMLDSREAIDKNWKQLRTLSQERNCLVLTASQTDADAYNKDTIQRSNFSGSKTKLAHSSAVAAINQKSDEQEEDVVRMNWLVNRHKKWSEKTFVFVARCLDVGNPAVVSCWRKK